MHDAGDEEVWEAFWRAPDVFLFISDGFCVAVYTETVIQDGGVEVFLCKFERSVRYAVVGYATRSL
jgi:hypothetical protein